MRISRYFDRSSRSSTRGIRGFLFASLLLCLLLVFCIGSARAQNSRKDDLVINARGVPVAGASVAVCTQPANTSTAPCSPLALIYSDPGLTQALANPTTSDGLRNYFFYASPGRYTIQIYGPGVGTRVVPDVILPNDPASAASNVRALNYIGIDMAAPVIPALTPQGGGSLANAQYFVRVTAVDATGGETLASPAQSITLSGSNGTINSSWAAATGAASYNVYRATSAEQAANTWHKFSASAGAAGTFSDAGASGAFPSSLPAVTTAANGKLTAGGAAGVNNFFDTITMTALAPPATPSVGKGIVYFKTSTKLLCSKDDTGVESCVGGGSAWSALTNPGANLSLSMGAFTSTFTHNSGTTPGTQWSFADTWNLSSYTGPWWKANITDTSSNANAEFFSWQIGGVEKIGGRKDGSLLAFDVKNLSGTSFFSPSHVEVACNTSLTPNCRTLAAGNNVTLTDGGAGGSLTLAVSGTVVDTTSTQSITGTKTFNTDVPLGSGNSIGVSVTNETSTGTTLNRLVKLITTNCPASTACAVIAATTDTNGVIGIVRAGAGITGSASVAVAGEVLCLTDNAATAGNYVQIGTTTAGACKDAGATFPAAGQVVGRFLTGGGIGTNQTVLLFSPQR